MKSKIVEMNFEPRNILLETRLFQIQYAFGLYQ